eukprot:g6884.t1
MCSVCLSARKKACCFGRALTQDEAQAGSANAVAGTAGTYVQVVGGTPVNAAAPVNPVAPFNPAATAPVNPVAAEPSFAANMGAGPWPLACLVLSCVTLLSSMIGLGAPIVTECHSQCGLAQLATDSYIYEVKLLKCALAFTVFAFLLSLGLAGCEIARKIGSVNVPLSQAALAPLAGAQAFCFMVAFACVASWNKHGNLGGGFAFLVIGWLASIAHVVCAIMAGRGGSGHPSTGSYGSYVGSYVAPPPPTPSANFDAYTGQPIAGVDPIASKPTDSVPAGQQPTGDAPGDAAARAGQRSDTFVATQARQADSGAGLLDQRIDVVGKGPGTIVDVERKRGKATRHVVVFDSGARESLLLSKNGGTTGEKFYMLYDRQ